jgi:hypothetical protein
MEKIYILKHDKVMLGPFTLESLKEKNLKPSDLIWYEGLTDWIPAGNFSELKSRSSSQIPLQPKSKFSLKTFFKKLFSAGN